MRNIVVFVLSFTVLIITSSCRDNPPDVTDKQTAGNSVGILFTVNGITVYRFGDDNHYHYFAVRDGRPDTVTLTTYSERCGKNCTRQVETALALLP